MKNHNNENEQIVGLLEDLNNNDLTMIDFDQLTTTLEEQNQKLDSFREMNNELETLREDYERRISGMTKAIAIADRKQGALAQAVELVNELPKLSSAELVDCYHRISARLRDMFPASYTRLSSNSTDGSLMRNPEDFK